MEHDLTGKTIIVVGGAGYIGSHVCKAVAACGGVAVTFDNYSSGHAHAVQWGPSVTVDIRDKAATLAALTRYRSAYAVVHLASSIEVGIGEREPEAFYANNVLGALNLLGAMRALDMTRLIFSSTCATYGETTDMPLTETQSQNPLSVYGKTKLAVEHMIQSYHAAYDLSYITLRYFNAAGADADGDIGEEHDPETHLIPIALMAAAGKRPAMSLFGTDYDTPDGTCVRDYIHVSDIARAHIAGFKAFDNGLTKAELNIGTGTGISNLQILEMVKTVTGMAVPYSSAPRRGGDLSQLYADPRQAQAVLGFSARHSDLENIIRTAWQFHEKKWV